MIGNMEEKNYFEIPDFLPIDWGTGKFKVMLFHFAANKMYLFVFSFEFTPHKVPCLKIQKGGNFNFFFFLFLALSYLILPLISQLMWATFFLERLLLHRASSVVKDVSLRNNWTGFRATKNRESRTELSKCSASF